MAPASAKGCSSPCASCKLLRRRCTKECIFAPYFPSDQPHKFALVHKVFGASNVSKMLHELPVHQRADAVSSLVYEATARVRDPVYGCVGAISYLQSQVSELQLQLAVAQAEILSIQMNHQPDPYSSVGLPVTNIDDPEHDKSTAALIFSNLNYNTMSHCNGFGYGGTTIPSANNQDPCSRESLWA